MKKKVVLAFSGGLDTSYCAKYLSDDCGLEVHTLTVDTGGFTPAELEEIAQRAKSLGVASHTTLDYTKTYYEKVIRYLIYGNVLKNGTYPLSVSAERMVQALATVEHARRLGADAVAHGSTGAGNDQVRFDMMISVLLPGAQIITPIRDKRLSREEEVAYLAARGVQINAEKARYSINKGLWGTSVGGKETLHSLGTLPEEAWPASVTKTGTETVRLFFERGELRKINDLSFSHPVQAIRYLQELASPYGIGRDIHVGDTIIGIKGRVGFEAAAPVLIIKAHHALEKHVLTKWQLYWKDQLSQFYGNWLHEGQYLDPVMRDMEAFLDSSQQRVTGEVYIALFPYRYVIQGIQSPFDLMSAEFGTYGEMNNAWTGEDIKGFTRIFGNQTAMYYRIGEKATEKT
ncbi:MAG: argininosuccinate synthase [Cyclobacteriaceae bacterium]|nr:MAG: argininosuccinate synthase [Cyclobacteriaceae bacterium]